MKGYRMQVGFEASPFRVVDLPIGYTRSLSFSLNRPISESVLTWPDFSVVRLTLTKEE